MTFLNWSMLAGLAAVAVPIVIHLLNRSRARVVQWGAMRFLDASLASRSRRILIEEVVLMALRCLIMALAALAVARPFLPSRPTALVLLGLPAVVGASICGALAAAMWSSRARRRWLLAAAAGLLAVPVAAGAVERAWQASRWDFGSGRKDVAVVLDGSLSMQIAADGNTNFQRAVAEARAVAGALAVGDGVSLIVAGPAPRVLLGEPTADRRRLAAALNAAAPTGGSMRPVAALQAASRSLEGGANPARKIVLITDAQDVGWDVRNEPRWRFLAADLARHPTPPQVILRALPPPRRFANAAVADVTLGRRIVGTDRAVQIDVKVASTGTEALAARTVRLRVDGRLVASEQVRPIAPGSAETVRFRHRFTAPGRRVVSAELAGADDLPGDDRAERVVDVPAELAVLVVDGTPSARPLEGAADFIDIALAPPPEQAAAAGPYATGLVAPRVVPAAEVGSVGSPAGYAAVVLADVPLLPKAFAAQLAQYVRGGGGLLIAPGRTARAAFYNAWTDRTGRAVMPARLRRFRTVADAPVAVLPNTFRHPAFAKLGGDGAGDIARGKVSAYWQVDLPADDRDVTVAAALATGEPLAVERRLGRGRVLMLTTALHPRANNLAALQCFVPLIHEMTYHLAAAAVAECNVPSGSDATIELSPPGRAGTGLKGEYFADRSFRRPKLTRVDRRIDFQWHQAPPAPGIPADGFAARWTGMLEAPTTGRYTFHLSSDDGARLWVGGRLVVDAWADRPLTESTGTARLVAGRKVPVRLEYYDATAEAAVRLEWTPPGGARQVIPAERLSCDAPPPAGALPAGARLAVVGPGGLRRTAVVSGAAGDLRATFTETYQPGLYRLILPKALASAWPGLSGDGNGVPFAVVDPADESRPSLLDEADLQAIREHLLAGLAGAEADKVLVRVDSTNELTAAVAGGIPGRELWPFAAVLLAAAIVAEIALTRYIAVQRKAHAVRAVSFGVDAVDVEGFRRRARELLSAGAGAPGEGEE